MKRPATLHGRAVGLALSVLLSACTRDAPPNEIVLGLTAVDTLVTEESELLGTPSDLAVGEDGVVYVLDPLMSRVAKLRQGAPPEFFGKPGGGPGEFLAPAALLVHGDTIRVADVGNGRVQVLSADGSYVRSYLFPAGVSGRLAMSRGGETAVATLGLSHTALATLVDTEGRALGSVGKLVAPPTRGWDFRIIKSEIEDGRVPAVLRNTVLPAFGDDGALWLVLLAEGVVQSYDRNREMRWSREFETPEVAQIREEFFQRNRNEKRSTAFYPLSYASDAVGMGNELWLLLRAPEEEPSVILVLSADGGVRQRLVLPTVRGARSLAVDSTRGKLYLAVPGSGSVLAIPLPERL